MQRITGTVMVTAGLLLLAAGCSGADDDGDVPPDTPEAALTAYFAAIDAGDDGACDFESAVFTDRANKAARTVTGDDDLTCADRVMARHAEVKDADDGLADSELEVARETDSQAMVEVTYPGEDAVAAYYLLDPQGDTWLVSDVRTPRG